jgi:hypothetical protein
MSVSPDGSSVYQATVDPSNAGLAVYARETAPVCQPINAATAFGKPVTVTLHCSDADGDAVTRSIVQGPAHGTLSAVNNGTGTVTYTPAGGFSGADNVKFAASDGVNQSASATATISVQPQPALSILRVSPGKFSLTGRKVKGRCVKQTKKNNANKPCRLPIRLRVSFKLNVAATVTFTLERQVAGRKVGPRCVKPTSKNSKRRKCKRLVSMPGKVTRSGSTGVNSFIFAPHPLGPGSYVLIATPAGGKPQRVGFKLTP